MPTLERPKPPVRNGTVAMPIKSVTLDLDKVGYPGWHVTFRTNPLASDYDKFLSNDPEISWEGLKAIILDWNFGDVDGNPIPLPKDGGVRDDLPYDVQRFLIFGYIDEFNSVNGLPKASDTNSDSTSST